jgi:hypothetical protein
MKSLSKLLVVVIVLGAACDRSAPKQQKIKELETVEVGGGPDAALTTELDQKARQVAIEVGGVLPSDFPSDLPVFSPSSVVDFGQLPTGGGFVEVDSPVPVDEVRSSLATLLQRSGWSVEAIGDAGNTYSKGGHRVRLTLTDLTSATRIRYEY